MHCGHLTSTVQERNDSIMASWRSWCSKVVRILALASNSFLRLKMSSRQGRGLVPWREKHTSVMPETSRLRYPLPRLIGTVSGLLEMSLQLGRHCLKTFVGYGCCRTALEAYSWQNRWLVATSPLLKPVQIEQANTIWLVRLVDPDGMCNPSRRHCTRHCRSGVCREPTFASSQQILTGIKHKLTSTVQSKKPEGGRPGLASDINRCTRFAFCIIETSTCIIVPSSSFIFETARHQSAKFAK